MALWAIPTKGTDAELNAMEDGGLEWANLEDAASAALRFACDTNITGRTLTVVLRSWHSQGYVDYTLDDYEEGHQLQEANTLISKSVVAMWEAVQAKTNGIA